jgi:hypothetical protein
MKRLLVAAALVAGAPVFAGAAVIYTQTVNFAATDAGAFSQPGQVLAGEFLLGGAASVTRATWYGTMFSPDPLNTGDVWSFTLNFHTDSGGLPGSTHATAAVIASVTDTGLNIADSSFGSERLYLFDASFSAVGLAAATPYWFSALNTGTSGTFRWTEATSGMDSAIAGSSAGPWSPWSETTRTPLNFTLHDSDVAPIPEPSTVALLGSALLALARSRRRPL